jgi:hypothetical protein
MQWIPFTQWRELYGKKRPLQSPLYISHLLGTLVGDIVYANVMGTHMIVLNSSEAAEELLERRGNIYSERAYQHFMMEMIGWRENTVMLPFGPRLKDSRRLFAQKLGSATGLQELSYFAEVETREFGVLSFSPILSTVSLQRFRSLTAKIILDVAYGYQVKADDDDLVELIERALAEWSRATSPGAYLVDSFTWRKLPLEFNFRILSNQSKWNTCLHGSRGLFSKQRLSACAVTSTIL